MKTLIIDGNNLIHRTWWTAKTQSKRTNTDTPEQLANFHIYFTLNAIFSYVTKYQPTKTIVVWDEKPDYQQNTRKSEFKEYKGNRSSDSSPHQNNETIKRMLKYLGIASIFPREREADDIVSYICKTFKGAKVIVSVDRDFLQLIDKDTILFDPIRKKEFTLENFEEETGWANVKDWMVAKCCMGDKSDNVPGIGRFGKAKIKKLIGGSLFLNQEQESIYKRNYRLFDLHQIIDMSEECEYYQDQLKQTIDLDWKAFVSECEERELNSLLKKKDTWYNMFILSNKLLGILG